MELVATIIAGTGAKLSASRLKDLAQDRRTEWLGENEAADIFIKSPGVPELRVAFQSKIADEPLDVIVQPLAGRRKKLLAADMESTIIEQELLDELAGHIGVRDKVASITARAMNGEIDFPAALRERVALFNGKSVSILEAAAKRITIMPGAQTLVATMKKHGAKAWLITGGFSYFAGPVAAQLGFDRSHANELIVEGDVITGEAGEPTLDRMRKKELLDEACAELNLSLADTVSVGDGANDVPMLNASNAAGGMGIAYHAKPKVRADVPNHVTHADLSALLFAQGYKKVDWVTK